MTSRWVTPLFVAVAVCIVILAVLFFVAALSHGRPRCELVEQGTWVGLADGSGTCYEQEW